ncbi:phosphate ABC transporter permease PstA [Motiliproteus sp. MSK22-1]|uniref:phosphate ABC transporter permease PstA n=1 Tax=Motiliproteus sp. MSK22-1 TaxID=1897630 RepID=UPI00097A8CBC|nr:phosphate ABC transporter permease PstA [Motiliproteus sp. MSK22-1]OMH26615.1 phosphate ABC transporter, permease protein PstA [Motiliproteus sp. MSK22-1]
MNDGQKLDSGITVLIWLVSIALVVLPLSMLWDVVREGLPHLSFNFIVDQPLDAGRSGGVGSLLISTFWILGVCLLTTIPIGLGCALYLSEFVIPHSQSEKLLGFSLDVLAGVPSIVFGLFGYAVFAIQLGLGFSILSGGLSLACMVLPLFIRTAEQALRTCPKGYRQAAIALNISHAGFISRILLPSASGGIAVAMIISIGRALAETAVLIFTAGYVTRMPGSVMDSGRSLSVHIYDLSMNVPGGQSNAAATALILVMMIVLINVLARYLSRRWQHVE